MEIIKKYKLNTDNEKAREIRIFGVPIFLYGRKNNNGKIKKYFFIFPAQRFEEKILQLCIDAAGENYDDIYLLRAGLGETYLANHLIKSWAEMNGSKNPIFINPQKANKTWKCFYSIPMKNLKINWSSMWALRKHKYEYKNHRIFVFLPLNGIHKIIRSYISNPQPHFKTLCEYIGLKNAKSEGLKINFPDKTIEKCENYLISKNINRNNFIFISKEALSIPMASEQFWDKVVEEVKSLGYDVVLNSKELDINEAIYVASLAKSTIALRSGFSEGISAVAKQMFVLYTPLKYPPISAQIFKQAYSLKNYPAVAKDNIFEYIYTKEEEPNIVNDIKLKLNKGNEE